MKLTMRDLEKISDIMSKFPDIEEFELSQEVTSGIGCITTLTIETRIQDVVGEFTVEISGVEDW